LSAIFHFWCSNYNIGRVIIELNEVTARELQPAVTVLQLFLSSSKPILRFAAIRALNKVAMNNPSSITTCNEDMESMISDQNRSIATLAITTLLKTGNESSIDRLMKQISTFMSDIQVKICTPCKFKVSAQTLLYFRTSLKLLSSRQSRNFA
jgi:hypothetical protein